MPTSAFGCSLLASPRNHGRGVGRKDWTMVGPISMSRQPGPSSMGFESIDDDALMLILVMLPADDARAAFCVSRRLAAKASAARELRLKAYWLTLFRSDMGFPEHGVAMLTTADVLRFEARLYNMQTSMWRCLSCLQSSPLRVGDFCADCVGNEEAFVEGNGKYITSDVTCGHNSKLVYYCPMCEAASCRTCLMGGACTFCLLLPADAPACAPCEV